MENAANPPVERDGEVPFIRSTAGLRNARFRFLLETAHTTEQPKTITTPATGPDIISPKAVSELRERLTKGEEIIDRRPGQGFI